MRELLDRFGLMAPARRVMKIARAVADPRFRRERRVKRADFAAFRSAHAPVLRTSSTPSIGLTKRALFVSYDMEATVAVELELVKALEAAGFQTTVLTDSALWTHHYFSLIDSVKIVFWEDFLRGSTERPTDTPVASLDDLLGVRCDQIRVGKISASTALRKLRVGSLDFSQEEVKAAVQEALRRSRISAAGSQKLLAAVDPELLFLGDRGYTPSGELFESAINRGLDVITFNAAHRSNTLMLKRYDRENQDEHPASLGPDTWTALRDRELSSDEREDMLAEMRENYESGDWHSEVGTQFNTTIYPRELVLEKLGIAGERRIAVIFPHILWDGTFFWGSDLFSSYEEWFLRSVEAACRNDAVDWIIKIHPAHVVKNIRDNYQGEPDEVRVIREHVGHLPSHVRLMPPTSEISTFSLFEVMDFCITVRGTVGIEAAAHGVSVVTAGTGRYDSKGFTLDPKTPEEYMSLLSRLQDLPPMSSTDRVLAERFAHGLFVLRPLSLSGVTYAFQQDRRATVTSDIRVSSPEGWKEAPEFDLLTRWVESKEEDFLYLPAPPERALS